MESCRQIEETLIKAFALCGYDFLEIMGNHTQKRTYTDLRSVAWDIYQEESGANSVLVSEYFGWNRSTVFCAIKKSRQLKEIDKSYRDLYDSIFGYYINLKNND